MMLATAIFTAISMSKSSKMIIGDFPPNSSVTFLTVSAAFFEMSLPVCTEPVKEMNSTSGCFVNAFPTRSPVPFTKLNTPFGNPASSNISTSIKAEYGVNSDGFKTTVQPAANALANFVVVWLVGKFHV